MATSARDIHVDPLKGNESHDGTAAPVRTIHRAVKMAQPGDTIHLAPTRFYESLDLGWRSGEPDKRIVVEGHGAVLDGSDPIIASEWETLGKGLYRKSKLIPKMDPAIIGRWFFLWDGKMNRMGRASKGATIPLEPVVDLGADEWTYVQEEDAFYIKLPEARSLADANIRYPKRSSAVTCGSYMTVKNVVGTHVYNDGYNIHGSKRGCEFENIAAIECGDDGFSAHEDAECWIRGFVSIENSTGICDVGESKTHYRDLYIKDCVGMDVFFLDRGEHSIENALIESSAKRALFLSGPSQPMEGQLCKVRLKNVLIRRVGTPEQVNITTGADVSVSNCTFIGLNWRVSGKAEVSQSVIRDEAKEGMMFMPSANWKGERNVYQMKAWRIGSTIFTPTDFSKVAAQLGGESGSQWIDPAQPAPAGAGATDVERLANIPDVNKFPAR